MSRAFSFTFHDMYVFDEPHDKIGGSRPVVLRHFVVLAHGPTTQTPPGLPGNRHTPKASTFSLSLKMSPEPAISATVRLLSASAGGGALARAVAVASPIAAAATSRFVGKCCFHKGVCKWKKGMGMGAAGLGEVTAQRTTQRG